MYTNISVLPTDTTLNRPIFVDHDDFLEPTLLLKLKVSARATLISNPC